MCLDLSWGYQHRFAFVSIQTYSSGQTKQAIKQVQYRQTLLPVMIVILISETMYNWFWAKYVNPLSLIITIIHDLRIITILIIITIVGFCALHTMAQTGLTTSSFITDLLTVLDMWCNKGMILSLLCTVHGFISSQLEARVISDPFNCLCCTNGAYERVWVDQALQSSRPQCLVSDLMWVCWFSY